MQGRWPWLSNSRHFRPHHQPRHLDPFSFLIKCASMQITSTERFQLVAPFGYSAIMAKLFEPTGDFGQLSALSDHWRTLSSNQYRDTWLPRDEAATEYLTCLLHCTVLPCTQRYSQFPTATCVLSSAAILRHPLPFQDPTLSTVHAIISLLAPRPCTTLLPVVVLCSKCNGTGLYPPLLAPIAVDLDSTATYCRQSEILKVTGMATSASGRRASIPLPRRGYSRRGVTRDGCLR